MKRLPCMAHPGLILLLSLLWQSCGTIERPPRPSATGKAGEMLVVMDKIHWEGYAGEVTRRVFQQSVPMFLQHEPMFDLVQIGKDQFGSLFETHRHIFMFEHDASLERPTLEIRRDVWSYPQMVVRVRAATLESFERLMDRNAEAFLNHYLQIERERLINAYRRMSNHAARSAVERVFGVQIQVPEGFFVAVEEENFMWLRRTGTRDDLEMAVLIATLPYTGPDTDFNDQLIRARRDSLTRRHIPGTFPGTYMTTYAELEPEIVEINLNGRYAKEMRSLWRVEGDFMGGPFVNYTFVDEATGRLFIVDAFVYAPKFDKRDYLRQLQAIVYSIQFPGDADPVAEPEPESEPLAGAPHDAVQ